MSFADLTESRPSDLPPLRRLFQGKSVNTPGFLLAVVLHEKLVARLPGKTKLFQLLDRKAFLEKVEKLQGTTNKSAAKKPATVKVHAKTTPAKSARAK